MPPPTGTAVSATNATPGTPDFATTSGTLTFNPSASGTQTLTITVPITNDAALEGAEQFAVNLSNATNGATIVDGQGVATITNDDAVPSLSINDVTVAEGNAGTTAFTFTVALSPASGLTTTVNYSTANGNALAGSDYAAASGTLTFAPGETSKTITVLVTGDTTWETAETFTVNLSAPTNATIADGQGLGTINNDDNAPPAIAASTGTTVADEQVATAIDAGLMLADDSGTLAGATVAITGNFRAGSRSWSSPTSTTTCRSPRRSRRSASAISTG